MNLSIKLDENNYMIRKDQFLTYVTTYGPEGIINGSVHIPTKFLDNSCTPNPSFLNWNKLNSIITGLIYGSVSASMMDYLNSGMTTKEQ